jgi:hypothetical protein
MIRNKLQLNASKTDVLIASSARSRKSKPVTSPLDICDEPITPSLFVKNLGVIVDSHLNMGSSGEHRLTKCVLSSSSHFAYSKISGRSRL